MSTEERKHSRKNPDRDIAEKRDWQPRIANIIAGLATIISLGLAIFTYRLYRIAADDSKTASNAATTAQKTLDATRNYDSISLTKQQITLDRAKEDADKREKSDGENSARQERSVESQIEFFKRAREQFEIDNEPYLQIGGFSRIVLKDGEPASFYYKIFNNGSHPVKAIKMQVELDFIPIRDSSDFVTNPYKEIVPFFPMDEYFSKETPTDKFYTGNPALPSGMMEKLRVGRMIMFFFGRLEYFNYINNKKRIYEFVIQFKAPNESQLDVRNIRTINKDE